MRFLKYKRWNNSEDLYWVIKILLMPNCGNMLIYGNFLKMQDVRQFCNKIIKRDGGL